MNGKDYKKLKKCPHCGNLEWLGDEDICDRCAKIPPKEFYRQVSAKMYGGRSE